MPIPFSPQHPVIRALPWSAGQCCCHRCLWLPKGEGQSGSGQMRDAPDHCWGHWPRSQGHGEGVSGAKGGRRTRCPSPLHPQARRLRRRRGSHPVDHLHEKGWPGRLLQPGTWLGGGVGGPRWRHGTRWVLQGEVGASGPTSPSPACRVGWKCLQAGGWGAAVGTFPKSFPVALGLATSAPHPPPPSPARPPGCSPEG